MTITIRTMDPANDADVGSFADIWNAVVPEYANTADEVREEIERLPAERFQHRWIAVAEGDVVG